MLNEPLEDRLKKLKTLANQHDLIIIKKYVNYIPYKDLLKKLQKDNFK